MNASIVHVPAGVAALAAVLAGAACAQVYAVQYDEVDSLVVHATGKHLHEPLTVDDITPLRNKAQYARLGDLQQMIDRTQEVLDTGELDGGVTGDQKEQVLRNLKLVLKEVLIWEMDRRNFEGKRRIILSPESP